MSANQLITHGLLLLAYLAMQLLVFSDTAVFGMAACMVYVGFLLTVPLTVHPLVLMSIGLGYGLLVDSFFDTPGMHATACVLLCCLRPMHLGLITPRGGYEGISEISIANVGTPWFISYSVPLVFVHHVVIFILEYWGSRQLTGLLSAVLSTLFTCTTLVLVQFLFGQVRK